MSDVTELSFRCYPLPGWFPKAANYTEAYALLTGSNISEKFLLGSSFPLYFLACDPNL